MKGYWNRPEETAAALNADGWYHSGDAAYRDADGYLYIVDRVKDMIVSGGENVYCAEVENAIYQHPAVLAAAVFGVPDEKWGERVHAAIVLKPEASAGEDDIINACRRLVAAYKVGQATHDEQRTRQQQNGVDTAEYPVQLALRAEKQVRLLAAIMGEGGE